MDWKLFIQLTVTVVGAVVGGWLGHRLSARRDLLNERRKLRVTYLLEAYRRLESGGNRNEDFDRSQIESAVADIQLLGSIEQAELARKFSKNMASNRSASIDGLISDLRHSLRKELELPAISDPVIYLRFDKKGATSFDTTLLEAMRDVADAKVEGASIATPAARERLDKKQEVQGIAAQIAESWEQIEAGVRFALDRSGVDTSQLGTIAMLQSAFSHGAITDAQTRSLRGLNAMRNLAVHGPDKDLSDKKLEEFLHLADAMKSLLEISGIDISRQP